MKERPITLNKQAIQAILSGSKTQHRVNMRGDQASAVAFMGGSDDDNDKFEFAAVHYGKPIYDNGKEGVAQWLAYCTEYPEEGSIPIGQGIGAIGDLLWVKESAKMTRSQSSMTLEITAIRVERLQDISEKEARSEGFEYEGWRPTYSDPDSGGDYSTARDMFAESRKDWDENPWVWVVDFKVVTSNHQPQ